MDEEFEEDTEYDKSNNKNVEKHHQRHPLNRELIFSVKKRRV